MPMRRAGQKDLVADFAAWARQFEEQWRERHSRESEDVDVKVHGPWFDRWINEKSTGTRPLSRDAIQQTAEIAYA